MMHFNFLKDALPVKLRSMRLAPLEARVRVPVLALLSSLVVLLCAVFLLRQRLTVARAIGASDRAAIVQDERRLLDLRESLVVIRSLSAAAALVDRARMSGGNRALEFADIANHLPNNVWVTSIARDNNGVTIDGMAADYATLGTAMSSLANALASKPVLVRAHATNGAHGIHFELLLPKESP